MRDVSVLITARNEEFLSRTVEDVLAKRRANTDVIVVADGGWPNPPIKDHPDVTILYHKESVGQRAGVNEAAKLSNAKFIMKLDAHCIVDEGFDVKLMEGYQDGWIVVPAMYNLHAFNWKCKKCGNTWYQGPTPKHCCKDGEGRMRNESCDSTEFKRVMVWKPRWHRRSEFMRFDSELHFQYWGAFKQRPEAQGDIAPTMSCIGACWFLSRDLYWKLGGMDEEHGSWGQMGTELACKAWLSGGAMMTNKKTWFAHMFRTQGGDFGFPYPISGKQVSKARKHSKDMWRNSKWKGEKYPLSWLIQKFWPIPGWSEEDLKKLGGSVLSKGIIFYTDNQLPLKIAHKVQRQLRKIGLPIVSASLKPMNLGQNIVIEGKRGILTYFKQIYSALEASRSEVIFFCEHDVLYHPSHFEFTPPSKDKFYFNVNVWKWNSEKEYGVKVDDCKQVSGMVCYRELALAFYREKLKQVEDGQFDNHYEPQTSRESFSSALPNVDIRHTHNLTKSRWTKDEFKNQKYTQGWIEAKEIPGWGKI
jgi:glycosyltransferase involved in cell wall biosynthesis